MLPSEIIKKVRLIEIKTRHIVNNLFGGEYHSAFKGLGMEFDEVREYYPGDDVRAIDWNVTARTGKPFIKKYNEERELIVILAIDVSGSCFFGTGNSLKSDIMIEIASILSFSAIKNNDKIGLLLFSEHLEQYIPPKKGKSHLFRVIREMIFHKAVGNKTDINFALNHIQRVQKRSSIIFLISDFWGVSYNKSMKMVSKKHDLINIQILDEEEINIQNHGLIKFHEIENNKSFWIDTNSQGNREIIRKHVNNKINSFTSFCQRNKIDLITINTQMGYMDSLINFFNYRMKKI